MNRDAWIEVNLNNLAHNANRIVKCVADNCLTNHNKSAALIGVIKANAYGNGAVQCAEVLLDSGFDMLAVATVQEGVKLRAAGIKCPIIVLGITPQDAVRDLIESNLCPVISSMDEAVEMSEIAAGLSRNIKCIIAIDSGMGRLGWQAARKDLRGRCIDEIKEISQMPQMEIIGAISHFSVADEGRCNPQNQALSSREYTKNQFRIFNTFCEELERSDISIGIRTIANSAAIIDYPRTMLDAVRPGIILYGNYPSEYVDKSRLDIKPIMSVKARIVNIKEVEEGTPISYGRRFVARRSRRIAILPLGYADGYARCLSNKARVILRGHYAPVIGSICMDQCMIDITEITDAGVGDEVIVMGSDDIGNAVTAEELARLEGTINYEVLCDFGMRLPHVYIT